MGVVSLGDLVLTDRFPGHVNPNLGIPTGGWDSTEANFVTTAADTPAPLYPAGTKIEAYTDNSNNPGYYTMAYLSYHCYSTTVGVIEAGDLSLNVGWCFHWDQSDAVFYAAQGADTSIVPYYVVGGIEGQADGFTDSSKGGALAIPCLSKSAGESSAAYVSGYGDSWGWFWVGGVCPVQDVTLFKGAADTSFAGLDVTCGGNLIAAPFIVELTSANGVPEFAGASAAEDSTDVGVTTLPFGCAVGYACTSER